MKPISIPLLFWILFIPIYVFADNKEDNREKYQLGIRKAQKAVQIDGELNEADWQMTPFADKFHQKWPVDTGFASNQTEVRVLFDDNFLYISAKCFDTKPYIIQTLKRDGVFWFSDAFSVLLDPVNKRTNGLLFSVNGGGAQTDGLVVGDELTTEWDTKWYSAIKSYDNYWSVEMAIPFKSLRYSQDVRTWGINFIRNDLKQNMFSTWTKVPIQMRPFDLGYTGALQWDNAPLQSKGNYTLIPYITGSNSRNFEDKEPSKTTGNLGLDAKIALTSSLNLDLTVNPDFSQVDVDVQVTNLSRFSIFFPERRNFFLENSDLFASLGTEDVRPFFSRKIGLYDGNTVPILFGARISGNLSSDWRIGLMSLQTGSKEDYQGQNYSVAVLQRRVFKRSAIKGFFINRQIFQKLDSENEEASYNRVGGLEFNYLTQDGKWNANIQAHRSFSPGQTSATGFYTINGRYRGRTFFAGITAQSVGTDYNAELGFVPRLYNYDADRDTTVRMGYYRIGTDIFKDFYPKKSKKINLIWVGIMPNLYLNTDRSFNEAQIWAGTGILFKNRQNLRITGNYNHVKLPFAANLIDGDKNLPARSYEFGNVGFSYNSDQRKSFSWSAQAQGGTFYNGTLVNYGGSVNYRIQPWGNFGVSFSQNHITLPDKYGKANFSLVGPRVEINFSNTIFWTTFWQYNTQANNFNINSRFQWRFKPMSDLFIVYSDDYVADSFKVKNRGIVVKLNYWLTL
jgi:Domain of unknown function (DUF5916)/Carbohydrate family 9 binding domain-like